MNLAPRFPCPSQGGFDPSGAPVLPVSAKKPPCGFSLNGVASAGASCLVVSSAVPAKKAPAIHADLESVLVTKEQIFRRVKGLGRELKRIYGNEEFTVVSVTNGAILFPADLLREVHNPIRLPDLARYLA